MVQGGVKSAGRKSARVILGSGCSTHDSRYSHHETLGPSCSPVAMQSCGLAAYEPSRGHLLGLCPGGSGPVAIQAPTSPLNSAETLVFVLAEHLGLRLGWT